MRQDVLTGRCPPEAEPEALIREARRRQRRRRTGGQLRLPQPAAAGEAAAAHAARPRC
jgi:hypothetical protein